MSGRSGGTDRSINRWAKMLSTSPLRGACIPRIRVFASKSRTRRIGRNFREFSPKVERNAEAFNGRAAIVRCDSVGGGIELRRARTLMGDRRRVDDAPPRMVSGGARACDPTGTEGSRISMPGVAVDSSASFATSRSRPRCGEPTTMTTNSFVAAQETLDFCLMNLYNKKFYK